MVIDSVFYSENSVPIEEKHVGQKVIIEDSVYEEKGFSPDVSFVVNGFQLSVKHFGVVFFNHFKEWFFEVKFNFFPPPKQ